MLPNKKKKEQKVLLPTGVSKPTAHTVLHTAVNKHSVTFCKFGKIYTWQIDGKNSNALKLTKE
jgi:hypothetical protein